MLYMYIDFMVLYQTQRTCCLNKAHLMELLELYFIYRDTFHNLMSFLRFCSCLVPVFFFLLLVFLSNFAFLIYFNNIG